MSRYIIKTIENEDVYINENNNSYTSNIIGKSINLRNESVIIEEIIAQGGYGTVYKCHSNHAMLALKKLCVNSDEKLSTCIQEIFILKSLDCDNVIRYVDSIVYQTSPEIYDVFILTELYRVNLCSWMQKMRSSRRVLEESMVLTLLAHLTKAVACLHQMLPNPIIHRDLKVENILIAYPQRYVLCDFGSATLKEIRPCEVSRQDLQEEISKFTTLSYRSPEMTDLYLDGGEHTIGRKCDIWAMGVLMYNVCFFSLPFGESVLSIMSGHFTVPDSHGYSNTLMKLLNLCLTTNPAKRPDIYQFSTIIFALLFEPNPIKNTENSVETCLDKVSLPMTESEAKVSNSVKIKKDRNANACVTSKPISTSIKPRERPKPSDRASTALPRPTQTNSVSHNNLTNLQSQTKEGQGEEWSKNQSSISVLTDTVESCSIRSPQTDDLIDFNGTANRRIHQMGNVSKSQSLSKNFSTAGGGQYWNMHQMISQSYQNVPCVPQPLYPSVYPNLQALPAGNRVPQNSYSQAVCRQQFYPINHTNSYPFGMNVGHRRLLSEPVGSVTTSSNFGHKGSNNAASISSSQSILQPARVTIPIKRTSVLNEFDPLIN